MAQIIERTVTFDPAENSFYAYKTAAEASRVVEETNDKRPGGNKLSTWATFITVGTDGRVHAISEDGRQVPRAYLYGLQQVFVGDDWNKSW